MGSIIDNHGRYYTSLTYVCNDKKIRLLQFILLASTFQSKSFKGTHFQKYIIRYPIKIDVKSCPTFIKHKLQDIDKKGLL